MRTEARSIDDLIGGIEARHDELDAMAAAAEELGTAPDDLVAIMRSLRVPLVKAPAEVGGDQIDLADQLRYFEALSYANATAGWTGFNHAGAAGMAGSRLSDEGVDAVFGAADQVPFMGAVAAPSGKFTRADGGIVASGTWRFASGIRHSDWALLTAIEDADRPSVRLPVVAMDPALVEGEWNVMALKGTGSVNVTLRDHFVPDHMIVDLTAPPHRGGALFALPMQVYVAGENLGFTLGVCRRFFDELATYARSKSRGPDGHLADRGAFHYEFGKGQLQVNAARAYGLSCLSDVQETALRGGSLGTTGEQHVQGMLAYCTESAANAVSHLFHFAGASALMESSVLQRCFRDAHGSVQHKVASNTAYDRLGASLLADPSG